MRRDMSMRKKNGRSKFRTVTNGRKQFKSSRNNEKSP